MLKNISIFLALYLVVFGIIFIVFIHKNFEFNIPLNQMEKKHRVVLIILDAFRHDYIEVAKLRKVDLPNLNRMAEKGARSMKVIPAYPSVTMPNHQTLVTGLYTPYHGITQNTFNDSNMGYEQFSMGNQTALNEARWYTGYPDPIWVSCEKSLYCKSGSMLYPNTDAVFNAFRPFRYVSQYIALNQNSGAIYPYTRRVSELIRWMKNDLIDFGLLYFDEPDETSHKNGPFHEKTFLKLQEMDGYIGKFLNELEKADLLKETDLLLTGDHGMTEMSEYKVIQIDDFVPPDLYKSTYSYPVGIIYPNEGKFDEVFNLYSKASNHIKVYKREEVPQNLHYSDNVRRISPIVTVVDLGWAVNSSHYKGNISKGNHGYSPYEDDMKTTLLATGPSFKRITINSSKHVDVYPLIMHLLGLKPNPHNGSYEKIATILTDQALVLVPIEDRWTYNRIVMVMFLMLVLQVISCFSYMVAMFCSSRRRSNISKRIAKFDPEQSMALITSE